MAVTTDNINKPILPRGADVRPIDSYNRASLFSGKALDFDGVNDTLTTTYTSGFTGAQEFTYCTYINADTLAFNQQFLYAAEVTGWGLQSLSIRGTGNIRFFAGTGTESTSYVTSETIEVNKWYFVVGVHTPTENKIYLNGVLNATAAAANLTAAPTAINIQSAFNGEISNAKVFNTALTAAQVADLYNNPEKVVPTGVADSALKLWLPMMEGAGTTAYDGSGNGNHGTINGATWQHGIGAPVSQSAVIDWNKLYQKTDASDGVRYSSFSSSSATEVTYAAWVYTLSSSGVSGSTRTISEGVANQSVDLKIGNNGIIASIIQTTGNSFATYTTTDHINKLTHIAFTAKRNGNVKVYVNGSEEASSACADFDLVRLTTINVHNENITGGSGFRGYIADLAVYGRELTATEISNLYNLTNPTSIINCDLYATNAGGFVDKAGNASVEITGSPIQALLPQGLTTGRDITGVNLFENVRKQGALNLDGNSWAEVHKNDSVPQGGEDRTLEVWVYYKPQAFLYQSFMELGEMTVFKRFAILSTSMATGNYIYIAGQSYDTNTDVSYNTNAWNHIVVTLESGVQKIYKNGVVISNLSRPSYNTTLDTIEIGRHKQNVAEYSYSPIAQSRIYNRALTASEVLNNYNVTKDLYI